MVGSVDYRGERWVELDTPENYPGHGGVYQEDTLGSLRRNSVTCRQPY